MYNDIKLETLHDIQGRITKITLEVFAPFCCVPKHLVFNGCILTDCKNFSLLKVTKLKTNTLHFALKLIFYVISNF